MNCPNCRKSLPDGTRFCPKCGHSISSAQEKTFCSGCGAELAPDEAFCSCCGTKNPSAGTKTKSHGGFKLPRIPRPVLGIIAAAVLLVLLFILIPGKADAQLIYVKDSQLQYLNLKKAEDSIELTKHLLEDVSDESSMMYDLVTRVKTSFSDDGKKLFYSDRINGDTYTLYFLDTTKRNSDPVKIDSGISGSFQITDKGDRVAYVKDGKLYLHDLKDKTKIDSDVSEFELSKNGKDLLYLTGYGEDSKLYLKKGNREKEKLASGVTELIYSSENLSTVVYQKEDKLYSVKNGKDPVKIASDVSTVWGIGDSGSLYFVKCDDDVSMWSLLTDDVGGSESEYVKSNYSHSYIGNPLAELYYYDGKECTLVTKFARESYGYQSEQNILVFSALPDDEIPQVNVSDYLKSEDYLGSFINETYDEACTTYILHDGKFSELKLDDISHLQFSQDGKKMLVASEYDYDNYTYTLTEVVLSGSTPKTVNKLGDEVRAFYFIDDTQNYVLWKNPDKDYFCDMYYNDEKIADGVQPYNVCMSKYGKNLYYMSDIDIDNYDEATLYCWDGKKSTKIVSDIYPGACIEIARNQLVYLQDYNSEKEEGDMILRAGKKTTKLDTDITTIINAYLP